jgi:hypothetical protein
MQQCCLLAISYQSQLDQTLVVTDVCEFSVFKNDEIMLGAKML